MLNSIRTKLTVWYVGILALVLIAFAGLTYFLVVRVLAEEDDENLAEMAQNFKASLAEEQTGETEKDALESEIREVIGESNFHDYIFTVYAADGHRIASTAANNINLDAALSNAEFSPRSFSTIRLGKDDFRVRRAAFVSGGGDYQLYILHSLEDSTDFLHRLRLIFLIIVPLALLLTGSGGYFLARKSLAPVVDMSRQAATISATNLNERLPVVNEKDELGNLARIINDLLVRLENSFEQQRRFMADASHELRTPLAIVRGESEVALSRESRPAVELRESLSIVHDESKRLTKIVEDLFTLARADAGQLKVVFGRLYLDELLAECVRAVQVLARKRNIEIKLRAERELPMSGDEQLLRRLFINLLDNAIKYNRENGKISVAAETIENCHRITISDTGTGIADDERDKIFERFYRADKARSRTEETLTGGAGLGLSIARRIAELHRGKIEIISSDEQGTVFAVNLPVNEASR